MKRLFTRASGQIGTTPGSLVYVGDRKPGKTRIHVIDYDESDLHEMDTPSLEQCVALKSTEKVSWINVEGLTDVETIKTIGEGFDIHPMILEDILDTGQRPKLEEYEDHICIVMKVLSFDREETRIDSDQISIVLGRNYVISFHEGGDQLEGVRNRIRSSKGRIRKMGPDYLAYALMDSIIDGYFSVIEGMGDIIEDIDIKVSSEAMEEAPKMINTLKRQMLVARRSIWPLREVIASMTRNESGLIGESTRIYVRDIYDHTVELIETIETFRDILSGLLEMHMSAVSKRMNEVMQVLTIIATIFIPLTFIAGVYGMNFINMPELTWEYGYPITWVVMIAIAVVLMVYFRRKRWI
jgi:magnesium transporter